MGIFNRSQVTKAAISEPTFKAAAASSGMSSFASPPLGANMVGQYYSYFEGPARAAAISLPVISRSRDLLASVIGSTPLQMYNEVWNPDTQEMVKTYIAPRSWLRQPDPTITYSTLMSWTFDDLFFFGRAFWYITSRTADGFPASFTRLPAAMITTLDQAGQNGVFFAPSKQVYFQGGLMEDSLENLVQFISPIQGILYQSPSAIETALKIESSRLRNAASSLPSGVLSQVSGEPLSAQELGDLASAFNAARMNNQTAALNEYLKYEETKALPDNMLMIESARYSAEDLSRLCNTPQYLCGISIGSYAYSNSQSAREELWEFGARQYMNCIAQTLSFNNVTPKGTFIDWDIDDYILGSMPDADNMPDMETPAEAMPETPTPPAENTQESLA
jgi:phage portal protein BeeE